MQGLRKSILQRGHQKQSTAYGLVKEQQDTQVAKEEQAVVRWEAGQIMLGLIGYGEGSEFYNFHCDEKHLEFLSLKGHIIQADLSTCLYR